MADYGYAALSGVYDLLNDQVDYGEWADHISETIKKYEKVKTSLVLDLGCGTGKMTFELRDRGFDMTGIDLSPEMLSVASDIMRERNISDVLLLCQDMSDFELYGTVDAAVCCLDGINHLTSDADAEKCFSLVHNYLVPDGLFIFDVNTPHKFESVYGQNDYILEDEGVLFAWQNDYDRESRLCTFYMSVFREGDGGLWSREDAEQVERCFEMNVLKELLEKTGFELLLVCDGYSFSEATKESDRWYIVARCIK